MSNEVYFEGYVVLNNDRGIKPIEVYQDGEHVSVWIDEIYADDIDSKEYLEDEYGADFYLTFSNARYDVNRLSIEDVWPELA